MEQRKLSVMDLFFYAKTGNGFIRMCRMTDSE
jgi:hypothetical protein